MVGLPSIRMAAPSSASPPALGSARVELVLRIAASLLGGYVFVWGFVALGTVLGIAAGLRYEEALTLMYLLAFLLFTAVFCWAYVAKSVFRVWAVLGGGGVVMTAVAWFGSRAL